MSCLSIRRAVRPRVYLGRPTKYKLQHIIAAAQRTDTLRYVQTDGSTPTHPDSVLLGSTGLLDWGADAGTGDIYAAVGWDGEFYHVLPLRELYQGRATVDTTQHLLPTVRVGGVAYDSVFRLTQSAAIINGGSVPRNKPARLLYYAKGYGVVGFVEGNTLWYRLPLAAATPAPAARPAARRWPRPP